MSIALDIRCAYCAKLINAKLGIIRCPGRAQQVGIVTCPACDSKFSIHISTKRKTKGKRLRAIERQRAEEHNAAVTKLEAQYDAIDAPKLLAEAGCDCAEHKPDHDYLNNKRLDGLEKGGTANGLPLPPRHRYSCPARKVRNG